MFLLDVFQLPGPHPLFGLIPAEFSAVANLRRLAAGLDMDLSTLRLQEHFVRLKETLPGSGTLVCRTRLRDVADTFYTNRSNLVIEGIIKYFSQNHCF